MLCATPGKSMSRGNTVNQSIDALMGCHKANKSEVKPAASGAPKEAVVTHQLKPEEVLLASSALVVLVPCLVIAVGVDIVVVAAADVVI
eukprot:scaffold226513_cov23-Prasinocladus_malaysianus.AAC.1